MTSEKDYWDLVEPYWEKISIYDGPKLFLKKYAAVPLRSRNLFAAHWCVSEISNGGFNQFFANCTGVLCPEAVKGLRAIGMPKTSAVVAQAMRSFSRPYTRHISKRRAELNRIDTDRKYFLPMERVFYKLVDTEAGGFEVAADRYANKAQ
jgi:hypothetical protein